MSKKWKTLHKSDKLLMSKENSNNRGEYIFKPLENVKYPHHLHFGSDFMRITNEKDKSLSFPRLPLDEKSINNFLESVKGSKERKIEPHLIDGITLLVQKSPNPEHTEKQLQDEVLLQLVSHSTPISGKEFIKTGYLGVINFQKQDAKFLVAHENKIYWATINELISVNSEINKFYKNKDKLIKEKKKQLENKPEDQ